MTVTVVVWGCGVKRHERGQIVEERRDVVVGFVMHVVVAGQTQVVELEGRGTPEPPRGGFVGKLAMFFTPQLWDMFPGKFKTL